MKIIATPIGTRLKRIERCANFWRVWISTVDFRYGTYLLLYDTGRIENVTERADQGPEVFTVVEGD